jgi:hypothetical protein
LIQTIAVTALLGGKALNRYKAEAAVRASFARLETLIIEAGSITQTALVTA